ncbi:hypothetical protein ON006_08505 [Dyadobacter pollutisoli]|uniref:HTH araC/xylS-type domain-containing protein n=2 Tax=Dyadobacter pollutisoli TaxID=2910158 RepID=A0A9E8NG76_9BACT|nr:hypothetical protein [Dyadobacter pollutisoli]WAC13991.1 hypothetical protein ON006_08505 [Dyadobacter pollutisoli]
MKFSVRKKFHLFQSRTRIWETSPAQLDHYRIIFILSGEGQFILDGTMYSYTGHGIIILKPGQQPVFQEDNGTEIFMIAFDTYLSDNFQKKKAFSPDFADTYKLAENLCNGFRISQGHSIANERDSKTIHSLIRQITFEVAQRPASHIKLIRGSIEMIVTILARNNFETKKTEEKTSRQVLTEHMIEYLRNELHQNKSIRIPEFLFRFNVSEEVANLCILNQTGMSLRNFIFKYKSDLFKSRMLKVDVMELSAYLRRH